LQKRRLALDPDSVWVTYRLASDLRSAGQQIEADAQMRALARNKPTDPEQVYAYGLYLSGNNQESAALAHFNTLSRDKWNSNIQELSDRLEANQRLARANQLGDASHVAGGEP